MRLLIAIIACGSIAMPAQAQPARPAPPVAPSAVCAALAADWRLAEQNLAVNFASGATDNSAPRASLRAIEDSNELAVASLTFEMMKESRCPLPQRAPRVATYLSSALACETARLRAAGATNVPACDRATWTPAG